MSQTTYKTSEPVYIGIDFHKPEIQNATVMGAQRLWLGQAIRML
jgi:hypothetical protein